MESGTGRTLDEAAARSAPRADLPTAPTAGPDVRGEVDAALHSFLADQHRTLAHVSPHLSSVAELSSDFLVGGKRLRPTFCYWGWRAAGRGPDPALMRAAAALELLQACALVHDDVMDASATRRGRPSAHKRFEMHHIDQGWSGDPAAFGVGAALLLGDLFLVWSDQLFTASGLPPGSLAHGRPLFDTMRADLMAGQFLDLVVQAQVDAGRADITTVLRYKSAKYTVEHPLQLGALLAGADDALVAGLGDFGLPLGEAFQLRDDLLGVFGDPAVTGKPAGGDLREGKQTLLIAEALATADAEQRRNLRDGLGRRDLDEAAVEALRGILIDTGAAARVEVHIGERLTASLAALDDLTMPEDVRLSLASLAESAVHRVR